VSRAGRPKAGVAYAVFVIIVMVILSAVLWAVFNAPIQQLQANYVVSQPAGSYDPSVLGFVNGFWHFLLLIVLFGLVFYGWREAQKRRPQG
jgi:preprotein translocase subunit SecY